MAGFKRKSNPKSDEVVASDDDRPTKRGKGGKSTFQASVEPQIDDNGDKYWEISKMRRVTVSEFKKMTMINIREYYEANGKQLPGKKARGISLTLEQYSALIALMPQIEDILREKGEDVPRPDYGASKPAPAEGQAESDDDADGKALQRSNIEATSDEDED
ncbi:uncharacterized protein HMPREF1541_01771 [Cyphellophora europaea CBS 101466]|uniref:Transcriptional coactivator p15 (PC4) C-terminal domain-containing protein n=1 Tax=Cyphellophora europaea (strain CBS 101466) TaxID=1220924 RepID=W2S3T7_CYPE1|nr:uncharacterized protein HMPREF1541_01771 [Cyphellophora europaea CBS 101466]ETN42614.1 hypothetical protein HMPREF1541_01771 [Cyphellophora europaea CBS 101466]